MPRHAARTLRSARGRDASTASTQRPQRLGQPEEAEIAFRRAVEIEPGDLATRANLALVLLEREKPALALETFSGYEDLDTHALGVKGRALTELGRFSEAEEVLDKAHSLDATHTGILQERELLYLRWGKEEELKRVREMLAGLSESAVR